jgi:hypothetical protein
MQPFSQVIEQERRQWTPFRRALSKEDQAVFDRMFACATQPLQAEVELGRPWSFEAVLMAVLLAHAKRLEQVQMRLEAVRSEKPRRGSWAALSGWFCHSDLDDRGAGGETGGRERM